MRQRLSLRPITAGDEPFLQAVFRSTREAELAQLPLDDAQKDAFCALQFAAQDRSYRGAHPHAEFMLVLQDDLPIGRLYLAPTDDALLVLDISLLPPWRNRGLGTALLRDTIERATRHGLPTQLQVASTNRAQRLYVREGFEPLAGSAGSGVYLELRRPLRPAPDPA